MVRISDFTLGTVGSHSAGMGHGLITFLWNMSCKSLRVETGDKPEVRFRALFWTS